MIQKSNKVCNRIKKKPDPVCEFLILKKNQTTAMQKKQQQSIIRNQSFKNYFLENPFEMNRIRERAIKYSEGKDERSSRGDTKRIKKARKEAEKKINGGRKKSPGKE